MRPSRSLLAGAIVVAAVLGVLVVVGRLSGGSWRPASPPTVTTVSLPAVPPPPSTSLSPVTARLRLGRVTAVTGDGDMVWAAHGCAVSRVDAHSGLVVATVGLLPVRRRCWVVGMAASADAVWVSQSNGQLLRVDPSSNRVVATLALAQLAPPAAGAGGVWAVCCWSGSNTAHPAGWLVRVDPGRNRVVARVRLPGLPTGAGAGGVWVTGAGGPIWRVDPASMRVVATRPARCRWPGSAGRTRLTRSGIWRPARARCGWAPGTDWSGSTCPGCVEPTSRRGLHASESDQRRR